MTQSKNKLQEIRRNIQPFHYEFPLITHPSFDTIPEKIEEERLPCACLNLMSWSPSDSVYQSVISS